MSPTTRARRDAAVRALNPVPHPSQGRSGEQLQQDSARLLALAIANPRSEQASAAGSTTSSSSRRRRWTAGRGAVSLAMAGALVAGGGVAVAATSWGEISVAWRHAGGGQDHNQAGPPKLVANGSGTSNAGPTNLQLWVAPTRNGGDCASVRAQGFSLDTCRDGHEQPVTTLIRGLADNANYRVYKTPRADYLYGRVDPHQVATLRLTAPDRQPQSIIVNSTSGYWVGSVPDTNATSLTLTAMDEAGRTVASQLVNQLPG